MLVLAALECLNVTVSFVFQFSYCIYISVFFCFVLIVLYVYE